MTVQANAQGVVTGKFTIPANVRAGAKSVEFIGAGGSRGTASFFGQGTMVDQVMRQITTITEIFTGSDPLAQTFSLSSLTQIGGVDLYIVAKGTSDIIVQIRETLVGIPTKGVIAEGRLKPADITPDAWNRFAFEVPAAIMPNVEYAIVVLCNDAVSSVAVAELGKYDTANSRWVTGQPYNVGVLLSSSNASTWTPHQDRDMAFKLLAAKYTETERVIDLGTVTVSGATDLVVLTATESPSTNATSSIELTLPDSSVISTGDDQVIRLAAATTGTIGVKARLKATTDASAVIAPGTQIVAGQVTVSAFYISRAVPADAAASNCRVIFDANLPSGATVVVHVKGTGGGDTWTSVPVQGTPKAIGDNWFEIQHYLANVNKAAVQVRLTLTGNAAARPLVSNLRVSIT